MKTERSEAPESDVMARIWVIERQIRLLSTLRDQANLEAVAHNQLARIVASLSDIRAIYTCRRIAATCENDALTSRER